MTDTIKSPEYRLYGRKKGHRLRKQASFLHENLLPQYEIHLPEGCLSLTDLFSHQPEEVWLEVGFGGGEHIAAQAKNNPHVGFIGCEPFLNGIASLLKHIHEQDISNIRIYPDDARDLFPLLPEKSISRCFVMFPDPWPKKRHIDRRFISDYTLDRFARVVKQGGEIRLASDAPHYIEWVRNQFSKDDRFELVQEFSSHPEGWPHTRYEQKAVEAGRSSTFFIYRLR